MDLASLRGRRLNQSTLNVAKEWALSTKAGYEHGVATDKDMYAALYMLGHTAFGLKDRELALSASDECTKYCKESLEFAQCLQVKGLARRLDSAGKPAELADSARDLIASFVAFREVANQTMNTAKAAMEAGEGSMFAGKLNYRKAIEMYTEAKNWYKKGDPANTDIQNLLDEKIRVLEASLKDEL